MQLRFTILSALVSIASPWAAAATELAPLQAGTFVLGEHTASVHYTVQGESFDVVVTVAPNAGASAPSRCTMQLAPGQLSTVSVGAFGTDSPATMIKLHRDGDTLSAEIAAEEG